MYFEDLNQLLHFSSFCQYTSQNNPQYAPPEVSDTGCPKSNYIIIFIV